MSTIIKPTVPEVLPIVEAFYRLPGNGVGGVLHVVLDDCNTEDSSVRFCRDSAATDNPPYFPGVDRPGLFLSDVLLAMSRTQRRKLAMSNHEIRMNDLTESEFWDIAALHLPEWVGAFPQKSEGE